MGFIQNILDNEYLKLENKEYEKRHGRTLIRKWIHTLRICIDNKYYGKNISFVEATELIDIFDVISFDIFDTLLIRPYDKPTDLFWDMEEHEKIPGFAINRINAERKARDKYKRQEDITLDQIYEEISEKYKAFKLVEMAYEEKKTQINSVVFPLFEYANNANKQIIIMSDMYLSSQFLKKMLRDKGIVNISKLYVSSETLKTKASGSMYNYMLNGSKVDNNKILHIGDNLYSDGNALYKYNMGFLCIDKNKYIWIERNNTNEYAQ